MAVITGTAGPDNGAGSLIGTAFDDQINGLAGDDSLAGQGGNDTLQGDAGLDTLDGGVGNDIMIGGAGNDSYIVGEAGDIIVEDAQTATGNNAVFVATETDTVTASVSYTLGAGQYIEILNTTNTGGVTLTGNELSNSITGNIGNDVLDGGADFSTTAGGVTTFTATPDTLVGGLGNDTYVVRGGTDVITEAVNAGDDTVIVTQFQTGATTFTLTGGQSVENIAAQVATSTGAIDLAGNAFAQNISGNNGANSITGGGGADTLFGFAGNDTYVVSTSTTVINEADGNGADEVQLNAATFVNGAGGAATAFTLAAGVSVESIQLTTGATNFNVTGNAVGQTINATVGGGAGNNRIDGGGGTDVMIGGLGDDTYITDGGDTITETLGQGTLDRIESSVSYILSNGGATPANTQAVEQLFAAGGITTALTATDNDGSFSINGLNLATDNIFLVGNQNIADVNDSANEGLVIRGNAGQNTLDGNRANAAGVVVNAAGFTTMAGLGGDDTYRVYAQGDVVVEDRNGGFDRVFTSATYDLSALTGTFLGVDYYAAGGQAEIELLSTASNAATTGGITLTGNGYGQIIVGNNGANTLSGGFGAGGTSGTINGGVDVLNGLAGNDSYLVTSTNTFVFEDAGISAGLDTVEVAATASGFVLNGGSFVETLRATGTLTGGADAVINITGNEQAQLIQGNGNANALSSGGGGVGDTLEGGNGNDSYRVFGGLDTIIEATGAGTGTDSVFTSGASYQIANGVSIEYLTASVQGGGEQIFLVGNELQQSIVGNFGNNTLDGNRTAAGSPEATTATNSDTLIGLFGSDTYRVYGANNNGNGFRLGDTDLNGAINGAEVDGGTGDVVIEQGGNGGFDQVLASGNYQLREGTEIESLSAFNQSATTGGYILRGNAVAQSIIGNNAGNTLDGRLGNDTLTGFGGNDVFAFTTALDGTNNVDQITDFAPGDRIGLATTIFTAVTFTGGTGTPITEAQFTSNTTGNATAAGQRIIFNSATGQIFYDADGSGAGASVLFAQVAQGTLLGFNDFISQDAVVNLPAVA